MRSRNKQKLLLPSDKVYGYRELEFLAEKKVKVSFEIVDDIPEQDLQIDDVRFLCRKTASMLTYRQTSNVDVGSDANLIG